MRVIVPDQGYCRNSRVLMECRLHVISHGGNYSTTLTQAKLPVKANEISTHRIRPLRDTPLQLHNLL